jgi:SAM-dependent methyltransferase
VVDVGCGAAGHVGRFISDLGPRVLGIDFSERSVAIARRLNPVLRFAAADVRALPLADGAVTGIVAFYCLIYSAMDDLCAALRELRRVSRPGGRLLAAVHGGAGAQRFADYKGIAVDVELHYRQADTFAAAAKDAGFVVERIESRPPYPFEHPTERLYVSARRP